MGQQYHKPIAVQVFCGDTLQHATMPQRPGILSSCSTIVFPRQHDRPERNTVKRAITLNPAQSSNLAIIGH